MSDRVTDPAPDAPIRELRAYLAEELDEESLAAFDAAQEQWERGDLQRMMDDGDFSELPDDVRPRE